MAEAKIFYESDCNLSVLDGKTVAQVVWDQNEKRYKQTGKLAYSIQGGNERWHLLVTY